MSRICGFMVCGPNEPRLDKVLERWDNLVDDGIICGNNTDAKTEKIIKKHGYWFYRDDREWGVYQPNIKQDLLHKVAKLKPDYILPCDADEIYNKEFTREEAEKLVERGALGYYFAIVNLWNDEEHYRKRLSFWNIRMYRFSPELGLNFERKNLHCGLAPPWAYAHGKHVPFYIKHYGLLSAEDRQKKVERYNKYDPTAKWKGQEYYDEIARETDATPFNEDEFNTRLYEDYKRHYEKK